MHRPPHAKIRNWFTIESACRRTKEQVHRSSQTKCEKFESWWLCWYKKIEVFKVIPLVFSRNFLQGPPHKIENIMLKISKYAVSEEKTPCPTFPYWLYQSVYENRMTRNQYLFSAFSVHSSTINLMVVQFRCKASMVDYRCSPNLKVW